MKSFTWIKNFKQSRLSRTLSSCSLTKWLDSITWQVVTLLLQTMISYEALAVQTPWGAKQSSINSFLWIKLETAVERGFRKIYLESLDIVKFFKYIPVKVLIFCIRKFTSKFTTKNESIQLKVLQRPSTYAPLLVTVSEKGWS